MHPDRRQILAFAAAALGGTAQSRAAQGRAAAPSIALDRGLRLTRAPFRLIDNRIFLEAEINGQSPFSMIFDTGGANIVTPRVAKALGLAFGDSAETGGAGGGTLTSWATKVDSVACHGVVMRDIAFTILPLDTIRNAIGFERLDGLFGHELLRRFVVDIDHDAEEIAFAERDGVPDDWRRGDAVGFTFWGNLPKIAGAFCGKPASFVIDTGDRSSLTLFAPYTERQGLRRDARFRGVTGWGVGGPIPADVLRAQALTVGETTLRGITTRMPLAGSGAFASDGVSGSIGTGVMRRFRTTYDYAARRIVMRRGNAFEATDPVDLAGLWIVAADEPAGRAIRVYAVDSGGPAEAAGVKSGDVIATIDGRPAGEVGALGLRAQFAEGPAGRRIALGLAREGAVVAADLVLADRLA